jgi:hypothetical protein
MMMHGLENFNVAVFLTLTACKTVMNLSLD